MTKHCKNCGHLLSKTSESLFCCYDCDREYNTWGETGSADMPFFKPRKERTGAIEEVATVVCGSCSSKQNHYSPSTVCHSCRRPL